MLGPWRNKRGYLVASVVLLVVKAVQLGGG
jgi:hypothetical protein